jgi:NADPH:quinone reductase-like Zn-dependent oxidoreductase
MPLEEAAAFSLGAQTAYGMVRRLDIKPGDPVLVTSATSNTSLFLIAALRRRGATVFATTTSDRFHPAIKAMGVERVHAIGSHPDRFPHVNEVLREAFRLDGFTAVLDPFFDLHLELAVEMLKPFGQYITCGMAGQSPHLAAEVGKLELDPIAIVQKAILRNLSIIGNCLGLRSDLDQALSDYAAGAKAPPIDSVFSGHQAQQFLHRTFMDRQRFGKVVFQYQ